MAVYGNRATPFTNSDLDIGNIPYSEFLSKLKIIVEKSLLYLKKKGYLIIFCKDMQLYVKYFANSYKLVTTIFRRITL